MTVPRFRRLYPPTLPADGSARWFIFRGADVVLRDEAPPAPVDGSHATPSLGEVRDAILIGELDGHPLLAARLDADGPLPAGFAAHNLRALLSRADPQTAALAGCAWQLLEWSGTMRHCPRCATPLAPVEGSWGRACATCGYSAYPPVSPAIIVLVHDGARALLTTKPGWGRRYSLVAGFVEPGESFEECVVREVREEVGVEVGAMRYIESQAWPFPHQIMVGFIAEYAGGEIAIDESELAGADWFLADALPELPPPFTISRRIIERWRAEVTA